MIMAWRQARHGPGGPTPIDAAVPSGAAPYGHAAEHRLHLHGHPVRGPVPVVAVPGVAALLEAEMLEARQQATQLDPNACVARYGDLDPAERHVRLDRDVTRQRPVEAELDVADAARHVNAGR